MPRIHINPQQPRALIGLAVACTGVLVAACGGAKPVPSAAAGGNSPVALSHCMRANGLTNFPDPTNSSGGEGLSIAETGAGELNVDGINFGGPALVRAEKACAQHLPGHGGPPSSPTAVQKAKILASAQCMRTHGVPNFPDPDFNVGPGSAPKVPAPGINPQSPAFQKAVAACGGGSIHLR